MKKQTFISSIIAMLLLVAIPWSTTHSENIFKATKHQHEKTFIASDTEDGGLCIQKAPGFDALCYGVVRIYLPDYKYIEYTVAENNREGNYRYLEGRKYSLPAVCRT